MYFNSMWPTFSSNTCATEIRQAFYYLLQDVHDQKCFAKEILDELKSILVVGLGMFVPVSLCI